MSALDLLEARVAFVTHARPSIDYVRARGIHWTRAEAACGGPFMAPVIAVPPESFAIDPAGDEAIVIEARAEDGRTVLDLVTWRASRPGRWRCMIGAAPALGMAEAASPYTGGEPLLLHRTPERWLQFGCRGAVLLDRVRGARWLLDLAPVVETIALEDDDHAAAVDEARHALVARQRLVVPVRSMEAA